MDGAAHLRGEGWSPAPQSRDKFTADQLAAITKYEGAAVQTIGYLVAIKPDDTDTWVNADNLRIRPPD